MLERLNLHTHGVVAEHGHERHAASPEEIFDDLDRTLVSIFDAEPLSRQPRYVVVTGSADGALLQRIHRIVAERTRRGRALESHPLTLVAAGSDEGALAGAHRALGDQLHIIVRADPGDPAALMVALRAHGVESADEVLHVLPLVDTATAERRSRAVHTLVEPLRRWASPEIVGCHGLVVVEVLGVPPAVAVEADVALAEVGLFRRPGRTLPYRRVTFGWLERRDYVIRAASAADLPALARLEEACWAEALRVPHTELARRTTAAGAAAWVVEQRGEVVAVSFGQRIADAEVLRQARFSELAALATPIGKTFQLLSLNVLPERRDGALSRELLAFVREQAFLTAGIERVVGVTRFRSFHRRPELTASEYLACVGEDGLCRDGIPRFHQTQGAALVCIVEGFRPEDADSRGCGILIEYALTEARGTAPAATPDVGPIAPRSLDELTRMIGDCVRELLPPDERTRFDLDTPLRDAGLDSLDLVELRSLLARRAGHSVDPTWFFRYGNARALASALVRGGDRATEVRSVAQPGGARLTARAEEDANEPIAIVGIACRFPGGASDVAGYWDLLVRGVDGIAPPSEARQAHLGLTSRPGGFLRDEEVLGFDAEFFRIAPREAKRLDPQQRLLLELTWEALEDAGMIPGEQAGASAGVFVGMFGHDYLTHLSHAGLAGNDVHLATGTLNAVAAGRIAYVLDLRGPALVVDTACSSALAAVHLARRALLSGECTFALAGAANLILSPDLTDSFCAGGMLASDGRCKTFADDADGYGRSEGAAMLVLKRLGRAQAEGDRIWAVLRGTAMSQDGRSNGLTAPNPAAQEAVIRQALSDARVAPGGIGYVEAHGTGTILGDPIEMRALTAVFGGRKSPLYVGSVKTNIGHTEATAGLAGLIKAVLMVRNGVIPPNLHFARPNPALALADVPAEIPTTTMAWPADGRPRIAGVSAFGLSGTNVHAVVAEAEEADRAEPALLLALGADSEAALHERCRAARSILSEVTSAREGAAVCRAIAERTNPGTWRLALTAQGPRELAELLAPESCRSRVRGPSIARPRLVFTCSGQGSPWVGMGRYLVAREPAFRAELEACDRAARTTFGGSIVDALFAAEATSRLGEADSSQLLLFAMQVALGALWRSWGIEPDAVVGHSMGEASAAFLSGALSREDAIAVVAERARLVRDHAAGNGAMLAVRLTEGITLDDLLVTSSGLSVAVENSPTSLVVSGDRDAIAKAEAEWTQRGIRCDRVSVDYAAHGPQMDALMDPLRRRLAHLAPRRAQVPLRSTVADGWLEGPECGADYWARNLRSPVRFMQAVEALAQEQPTIFLELSPHPLLLKAIEQTARARGLRASALPSCRRESERATLIGTLGELFGAGLDPRWSSAFAAAREGLGPELRARIETMGDPREAAPSSGLPFVLSARTDEALRAQAERLRAHVEARPELDLSDVAWSLATTRSHFEQRAAFIAADRSALLESLEAIAEARGDARGVLGSTLGIGKLAILFSGRGGERARMGMALRATFPVFRDAFDAVCSAFDRELERPLRDVLFASESSADARAALHPMRVAEPALFALEVALFRLLASWGVQPDVLLGDSVGEIAAAHVAGVLSLVDACALVAARGRLMRVLRRETGSLEDAGGALVSFAEVVARLSLHPPTMPIVSSVTGALATANDLTTADYWVRHAREAGRFEDGVRALQARRVRSYLELGPDGALSARAREALGDAMDAPARFWSALRDERPEPDALLSAVAGIHAHGHPVDLRALLTPLGGRAISLPTYPFQRERCWLDPDAVVASSARERHPAEEANHPLLHRTESHAGATRIVSTFSGEEPFLAHHVVKGTRVLPGVAHIEMARAAVERSIDPVDRDRVVIRIEDMTWLRPLVVSSPAEVHLTLGELLDGRAKVAIVGAGAQGNEETFSLGYARLVPRSASGAPVSYRLHADDAEPVPTVLDLAAIRERLRRRPAGEEGMLDPDAYYRALESVGLVYGPAHRGLVSIQAGTDERGAPELLARLVLPDCVAGTQREYGLHPSLVDSAVQAAVAVAAGDPRLAVSRLFVPFALKSIDCTGPCTRAMWAWVRVSAGAPSSPASVRQVDIDLCDEDGAVCVRMRELSLRPLDNRVEAAQPTATDPGVDLALFKPIWREKACPALAAGAPISGAGMDYHLAICGFREQGRWLKEAIRQGKITPTSVVTIAPDDDTLAEWLQRCATQLFELIQGAIRQRTQKRTVIQVLVPREGRARVLVALAAMLKTACLENPKLSAQVLALSEEEPASALLQRIEENRRAIADHEVRYEGERRFVAGLEEVRGTATIEHGSPGDSPWKEGGAYLITGGAGGLGLLFAKEILTKVHRVSVVLTGRSELGGSVQETLRGLQRAGANVQYCAVDAGDARAVADLVGRIDRELGGLNGVIHAAGITRDNFILKKTKEEFEAVLKPKVAGACHLYESTQGLDLDFFVSFASIVATTGNVGQADYCTANAFLDALAELHGAGASSGRRCRVLSIDWPLWRDGGMGQNGEAARQLEAQLGVLPMETAAGLAAFYRALAGGDSRSVVMNGESSRIRAFAAGLGASEGLDIVAPEEAPGSEPSAEPDTRDPKRDARDYLKRIIGAVLGIPEGRLNVEATFTSYGMDSILSLESIRRLEQDLGSLSKTLFFEHESIAQLAEHLGTEYSERIPRAASPAKTTANGRAATAPRLRAGRQEPKTSAVGARDARYAIVKKSDLARDERVAARVAAIKGDSFQDAALFEVWPDLFVLEDARAYCHILVDRKILFATEYTGEAQHRETLFEALLEHCAARGYELGFLDMSEGRKLDLESRCGLVSLPVGVVQTLENVESFSLAGGAMRRLRYAVEKFRKAGESRTVECSALDPEVSRAIHDVVLAWCEEKKVVNNVDVILNEMKRGNLLRRYRVFLTYVGESLQNVILILPFKNGYLMDQEYYLPSMPLGGTEFAVAEIVKKLASEGHRELSLGLTWGHYEAKEGASDPEGEALLKNTKTQLKAIFERGAANHQYKAKYGPREYAVYLYRRCDSREDVVVGCLSQFFQKGITHHDVKRLIGELGASGAEAATDARFDVTKLDPQTIRLDLVSDSWSHLGYGFIRARVEALTERVHEGAEPADVVLGLFGVPHVVLTTSGRVAERLFFQTQRTKKKIVLQNVLFESTLHNLVKGGFAPIEIPDRAALDRGSEELFRGGMDIGELTRRLDEQAGEVAMIFLELCNNASGGYPVSLEQIRRIAELGAKHGVPVVMDITRILKNAELIRRHEAAHRGRDLWAIVTEIAGHAAAIVGSLSKDFGVSAGGIVAVRDANTIKAMKAFAHIEGGIPGRHEAALLVEALRDRAYLESKVSRQLDRVRDVHAKLAAAGVPAVQPGAGHCVLIRVDEIPGYEDRSHARESYLRTLAVKLGIRGGIHFVGNQTGTHLNQCVRLALPLGLEDERLASSLVGALEASVRGKTYEVPDFIGVPAEGRSAREIERPAAEAPAEPARESDIAIVGLSGRYPGARTLDEFWANLVSGARSITEVPSDRWDWRSHYHPDAESAVELGKSYGKWGAFLEGFDQFDPLFFKISPREAEYVDPQERLFLEECWKALEDAGYPPSAFGAELRQRTGVFGGMTKQGFNLHAAGQDRPYQHTSLASMVSRVSHCLDLKGPALANDSHCASALVAIHEACEYLRQGKGDLAIAGAVNLNLHPFNYSLLSKMQVLSRDERSAAFAEAGTGYVPGEGAGAVVLKGYRQALEDGDHVYAVIRGTAINQNGKMARFGMPSQKQQEAVIMAALRQGKIDPRTIGYIEASAFGSEVGDAVEMAGLSGVFSGRAGARGSYRVGSIKPNIGHGEAVSGMAQLTKVLLSLEHETLVPTLVSERRNPNIDFERLPFEVQVGVEAWHPVEVDGQIVPRRAGITATGASGVNAHIVLEQHVENRPSAEGARAPGPHVFVLSARDGERLREYARRWITFLEKDVERELTPIVYSLQIGREPMASRLSIVAADARDLAVKLTRWCDRGGAGDGESVFSADAAGAQARSKSEIERALRARDSRLLARWWAEGNAIAWGELHGARRPRRAAGLPGYPFARGAYPLPKAMSLAPDRSARPAPEVGGHTRETAGYLDGAEPLERRFLPALTALFAEVFKLPASRIDAREPLESYGIDSYLITVLNARLGLLFKGISKTLLFEHQTIAELAGYLLYNHAAACAAWIGSDAQSEPRGTEHRSPQVAAASTVARHRNGASAVAPDEPIAVIGISGRYPMAKNVHEHWENLRRGRDCVVEIPADRWPLDGFYEPVQERAIANNQCYSKWGGFLDGFSEFDSLFFNISPREAMNMDPQERIFLQTCWEVLEDAAYTRERIAARHRGRLGVFAGVTRSEFCLYGPAAWKQGKSPYTSFCSLVNRVSYFLNANGPSMPIDTMCSSSLVAVHEACEHLRRDECEVAIAGGVNLSLHPYMYVSLSAQRMLSSEGRCKSFGKGGNGYVPGEGVGAILLKPLSKALADKDRIYALIRASSVNHGGKTNGYTVPNPIAQGQVIRRALEKAKINARAVSYVEAHGTGTELGDPIEITGLTQAFRKDTADTGFCALGSVKSNIGHLEAASGIAGLTKVILQMRNKTLVPSLHAEELNPNIDFSVSPFVVNRETRDWERPVFDGKTHPRIAGVSSFGAGGSNGHVLVEEYVDESDTAALEPVTSKPVLIVLSAKKPELLTEYARSLLDQIREPSAREGGRSSLEALAYTLQIGREALDERLGVVVCSMQELDRKLQQFIDGVQGIENLRVGNVKRNGHHVQ